jgi:hypothetical protein
MSEKQLNANRENAKKSTGPRTEEGKQASANNAVRHGLCSRQLFVPPGEEEHFEQFYQQLLLEIGPAGELEITAFEKLVHSGWRIQLIRLSEAAYLRECNANGLDPILDDQAERKFKRLEDYLRRAEAAYARALREIRMLQTDRHIQELVPGHLRPGSLPAVSDVRVLLHSHLQYERTQLAAARQQHHGRPGKTNPNPRSYQPM